MKINGTLTKEQLAIVTLCDEWLQEVGLPLYSEMIAAGGSEQALRSESEVAPCSR